MRRFMFWGAIVTAGAGAAGVLYRLITRTAPGEDDIPSLEPPSLESVSDPRAGLDSPRPWTSAVPCDPEPTDDMPAVRYGGVDEDAAFRRVDEG